MRCVCSVSTTPSVRQKEGAESVSDCWVTFSCQLRRKGVEQATKLRKM